MGDFAQELGPGTRAVGCDLAAGIVYAVISARDALGSAVLAGANPVDRLHCSQVRDY